MNDLAAIKVIKLEPGERTRPLSVWSRMVVSRVYGVIGDSLESRTLVSLSLVVACPFCGVVIFMQSVQSDVEV